jgi:hypothetical protein
VLAASSIGPSAKNDMSYPWNQFVAREQQRKAAGSGGLLARYGHLLLLLLAAVGIVAGSLVAVQLLPPSTLPPGMACTPDNAAACRAALQAQLHAANKHPSALQLKLLGVKWHLQDQWAMFVSRKLPQGVRPEDFNATWLRHMNSKALAAMSHDQALEFFGGLADHELTPQMRARLEAARAHKAQTEAQAAAAAKAAEEARLAAERRAAEEAARIAREKAEAERRAAEEARIAREKAEAERKAREKAEAERQAALRAAEEARIAREKAEAARIARWVGWRSREVQRRLLCLQSRWTATSPRGTSSRCQGKQQPQCSTHPRLTAWSPDAAPLLLHTPNTTHPQGEGRGGAQSQGGAAGAREGRGRARRERKSPPRCGARRGRAP